MSFDWFGLATTVSTAAIAAGGNVAGKKIEANAKGNNQNERILAAYKLREKREGLKAEKEGVRSKERISQLWIIGFLLLLFVIIISVVIIKNK